MNPNKDFDKEITETEDGFYIHNPHDRFARKYIGKPGIAADILRHYADPIIAKHVDLDHLKPAPTHDLGKNFREVIKDLVFVSQLTDEPGNYEILFIMEHKSYPDSGAVLQLFVQLALSWWIVWTNAKNRSGDFRLPFPFLVLLYNGTEKLKGNVAISDLFPNLPEELRKWLPEVKITIVNLRDFDLNDLPGEPVTQAVVESMICATEGTFAENLPDIFGKLSGEPLDRVRETAEDIVTYCGNVEQLSKSRIDAAVMALIKEQENSEMTTKMYDGFLAASFRSGEAKGYADGEAKGIERGMERGIAEGRAEGKAEGQILLILQMLKTKFGSVPMELQNRLFTITDTARLVTLGIKAATSQSIDEFESVIEID